jgi:hypothetical protein
MVPASASVSDVPQATSTSRDVLNLLRPPSTFEFAAFHRLLLLFSSLTAFLRPYPSLLALILPYQALATFQFAILARFPSLDETLSTQGESR